MARTTPTLVQTALGRNWDTTTSVSSFITSANAIVDEVVVCATAKGKTLSVALLQQIETYLAAYFYAIQDPIYTARSTGRSSGSFQTGTPGQGFSGNEYGRAAIAMDISGCLAGFGNAQVAGMSWLGKPPSEQIPYDQRD